MFFILIFNLLSNGEILNYKLYWLGMEAGFLNLSLEGEGEAYKIEMKSQTTGMAKKFYFMESFALSYVRASDFQTIFYMKKIKEKKKNTEEVTIFFPEENLYYFKGFNKFDFFSTDTLSILYFLRIEKDLKGPLKVYEKGKFYEVSIKEEKDFILSFKGKNYLTKRFKITRKDKKKSEINLYLLKDEKNTPISFDFSFPLGTLKAILQCY